MNSNAFLSVTFGIVASCASACLHAQALGSSPVSADTLIARFEREIESRARTGDGVPSLVRIFDTPGENSTRVDSILNGLERLVDQSSDRQVRSSAAAMLAFAGEEGRAGPPVPRIMRRLERVYHRHQGNDDRLVRVSIVSSLPLQSERRAAAAMLRTIASQPDPGNDGTGPHGYFSMGDLRTEALARLASMGAEGKAVLQAMHRNGEARSPQARIALQNMAQRDFPVTDAVERRKAANRESIVP